MATESIMHGNAVGRGGMWSQSLQSPWVIALAAMLAMQLIAAIALSLGGRGSLDPARLDQPLLDVDPAEITSVQIQTADGSGIRLAKSDEGWVLPELGDFPADGTKVDQLIEQLAGLKRPLPVATSPEALARHKVADEQFERKVTLGTGDEALATLILGDSPGFRRLFARPASESVVYDIDLALFDASDRRDDWTSRDALRVAKETIEGISAKDWSLVKGESGWQLNGSETPPDQAAVDDLLAKVSGLGYRGVLGTESKPEYGQDEPTLDLTLVLTDGKTRTYRISKTKDGPDLVLKSSDSPWYYKLSEYDMEGLVDLDRDKLLGKNQETDANASAPAATTDAPAPTDATQQAPTAATPTPGASDPATAGSTTRPEEKATAPGE